jgi:hypothetical protein
MQAGQYGNHMDTNFLEVLSDKHCIGGDSEYCGENDAQLGDCINVFYHEASVGKNITRAVLFDLEPGVIDFVALSSRSANSYARITP